MRRKTIAKRLLDLAYEEEDETEEDETSLEYGLTASYNQLLCHRQPKRRKHTLTLNTNGEENSAMCPTLNSTETHKLNIREQLSPVDTEEEHCHTQVGLGGLQSRSKAELVAMVLSMQREMDSLKEQIRCLTACGKLARNLEALIENTELWSNGRTTSPSIPQELLSQGPAAVLGSAGQGTVNASWTKMEPSNQQNDNGHHLLPPHHLLLPQDPTEEEVQDGATDLNPPPLHQKFITAELLECCNTSTTAQKLTNDLLRGLYERDCLASHSISGLLNNRKSPPKPALPAPQIHAILRTVQHYFPGKTDSEVKGYIRQKLQNEAKRLRKKPRPLSTKEEEPSPGLLDNTP